ncbi:two-component system, NtrC family, C4-dicarboxylate transport sensor histidine kinase DctB [Roseovarius lutimaris]|uniref:C4-dicarboxylate transport sensor protein DctB n=1 Tax=Roseovarius lutimaris TaxID=1005928 RepID=A0A1I5FAA9_9RHOB|nr:ATP-binding protein [Roseovarius lutimaris]SFO20662.1 two-component system, NtrC family, C4-dicarboxylate transport sensor histidine kinase DctB [Roseovarius lutimaris]
MSRTPPSSLIIVPFVLVVALIGGTVWHYGYRQALDQLERRGTADMSLVLGGLVSDLQRYRDQAVALAGHPTLTALSGPGTPHQQDAARRLLVAAADRTGATALFYVDAMGDVLAGSKAHAPEGLARSEYFTRAMDGALGTAHGLEGAARRRVFQFAAPSFASNGKVQGALVVLADAENVEFGWRGSQTAVFLVDDDGRVFMSNRSELLGWRGVPGDEMLIPPEGAPISFARQSVGPHEIWQVDLGPYLPKRALQLGQALPRIGMTGVALVNVAPARQIAALQAGAVAGVLLFFGALLVLTQERRRSLARANAQLEGRVAERTATLTRTNLALRREVRERQEAEAALKRAQAELVQAGKLRALGQMSAGISHELNQPLMAIRQFAANGGAFLQRKEPEKAAENLGRIDEMAHRMSRIIRNLRAFVRNENEPMGQVDIVQVIESALEMTGARLRSADIEVVWQAPAAPVWVRGGEVRLGQVLINLITNAADAMTDSDLKRLEITLKDGAPVTVRLRDTGPGIEEPEKIFDPFYSTKLVGAGDGMGLGLSISYGLVQSFGGKISGANTGSGAEFTVELDPWADAALPAEQREGAA